MFTAGSKPGPVDDLFGMWAVARPGNVEWMSTVAYFFGRDLQADLGVTVGLIVTASGGTPAESWIPWPVIEKHAMLRQPWANGLGQCYGLLIQPLRHCTIRGAVWYHGESNTRNAFRYRVLLPTLIESWRDQWQLGDFPVLIVQLPGWKPVSTEPRDSAWAELRESQQLALAVPNTALAVTTDWGDEWDIHPLPKHGIGSRLAQITRGKVYGENVEWSGPVLDKVTIDGPRTVLSFTHAEGGLVAKKLVEHRRQVSGETRASAWRVAPDSPDDADLLGFAVCGADKQFHSARAKIEGQSIIVTCDAVPQPVAVRYGWAAYPLCNLYNRAGLPASPFRTDDFPCTTRDEKAYGLADN